jgi:NADPH-dependent curcumin reductase CurA
MTQCRTYHLAARPSGEPGPEHFDLRHSTLPAPAEGEVALRILWMSLDPYMRGRMSAAKSYVDPFEVGGPLQAGCIAEVIDSRSPRLQPGDVVMGYLPWATHAISPAKGLLKLDPTAAPLQAWLGVLGMPGLTAWVGLNVIARAQPGETIFVSAATGAVGSLVCQLARAKGLRVIGCAGGAEKCALAVADYGAEICLDHRAGDARALSRQLAEAAPDGVNIYFENVGGKVLESVLPRMANFGRIALCGMIAWYSDATGAAPLPFGWNAILTKRLGVEGFIVTDHQARAPEFLAEVLPMVQSGQIRWHETIAEGLEAAPGAFVSMLRGGNMGKQLVRLT